MMHFCSLSLQVLYFVLGHSLAKFWGFPGGSSGKESTCQCRRHKRHRFSPWVGKIPWRRAWQSTLVLLPGESHGQRNLAGYSPWGCKESNLTEHALKGPSLSLAVSSEFLARVSCPSPWRSRTT